MTPIIVVMSVTSLTRPKNSGSVIDDPKLQPQVLFSSRPKSYRLHFPDGDNEGSFAAFLSVVTLELSRKFADRGPGHSCVESQDSRRESLTGDGEA